MHNGKSAAASGVIIDGRGYVMLLLADLGRYRAQGFLGSLEMYLKSVMKKSNSELCKS